MKSEQKTILFFSGFVSPNLLCPWDEIYSVVSYMYRNSISGKKAATHIILHTQQYHATRSTKRKAVFCSKSFFKCYIHFLCILFYIGDTQWIGKSFTFHRKTKGYMNIQTLMIFSIKYDYKTSFLPNC